MGRGNESLFTASEAHDQDGRHSHIWKKPFKNLLLRNQGVNGPGASFIMGPIKFKKNDNLGLTFTFLTEGSFFYKYFYRQNFKNRIV